MSDFRSSIYLEDLLEEPFGPFLEEHALTTQVRNTTPKNPLILDCVQLETGSGDIAGLDECEPCQPSFDRRRFGQANAVVFKGVLNIDKLSWLTPQATDILEKTLRERDYNARLATDPHARRRDLTLEFLYQLIARGSKKLKLVIRGIKLITVSFLQSDFVPNGLMLTSKLVGDQSDPDTSVRRRRYEVASLHIETYDRSRRYLNRWRLYKELQTLLALDAGPGKSFRDNETPLAERTPEWFIDLYVRHRAYSDAQRRYRVHHDSDSDSDIERGTNGTLKPGRQHALRHVPRAEIRFYIERDGEWVVDQMRQIKKGRWLDVGVWANWFATKKGRPTEGASPDSDMEVDDHPGRYRKHAASRKRRVSKPVIRRILSPVVNSDDGLDVDETMMRTYDPDFSPVSTTFGSPISTPSRPGTPIDPALLALLPAELWHPPNVNALQIWTCPWKGCFHMIDLLHLTDEDMDHPGISEEDKHRFRSKDTSWNGNDVWARDAFALMADKHHFWHFDQAGIDVEGGVDRPYGFRWRHPSSHPRPSQFRRVKIDDRQPEPETVKQEDV